MGRGGTRSRDSQEGWSPSVAAETGRAANTHARTCSVLPRRMVKDGGGSGGGGNADSRGSRRVWRSQCKRSGRREDGGGTGKRRPGVELGLTALSVGSRSTPLTFPVTTPVMMMPGTRAASRRWVGRKVSGRPERPDLAGWVARVAVFIQYACAPWTGRQTRSLFVEQVVHSRWYNGPHKQVIPV